MNTKITTIDVKCEGCRHITNNATEFCYMFKMEQPGDFCGQNTMMQEFFNSEPELKTMLHDLIAKKPA